METILNDIKKTCGKNGATTMKEISDRLNLPYSTVYYWVNKFYRLKKVSIVYPGLGMARNSERFIYPIL